MQVPAHTNLPRRPLPSLLVCLPIPSVCRFNRLGAEGGKALARALHHLPQLRELDLRCALATAQAARGTWHEGWLAPTACVSVPGLTGWSGCDCDCDCDGDGDSDGASDGDGVSFCLCALISRVGSHPQPPPSHAPIPSACSWNGLGDEGVKALAQALHHLPQLQELHLRCALATAQPALDMEGEGGD